MIKKYGIIIAIVIFLIVILVAIIMLFNRENAKDSIHDYISKQGIKETQLKYADFHRDFKLGGYSMDVYVKGEKSNIYYEYSFKDKKVKFQAYSISPNKIKEKYWGGNGLSDEEMKELKYPPLSN